MELDITDFFNNAAPMDYSASVAEIGNNAGQDTWRAAVEDSTEYMLLDTEEKRDEFRRYVKGFGAWGEEEIARWTDVELNALCLQMIAGDIREGKVHPRSEYDSDSSCEIAWRRYYGMAQEGTISGRLTRVHISGKVYYSIGE